MILILQLIVMTLTFVLVHCQCLIVLCLTLFQRYFTFKWTAIFLTVSLHAITSTKQTFQVTGSYPICIRDGYVFVKNSQKGPETYCLFALKLHQQLFTAYDTIQQPCLLGSDQSQHHSTPSNHALDTRILLSASFLYTVFYMCRLKQQTGQKMSCLCSGRNGCAIYSS